MSTSMPLRAALVIGGGLLAAAAGLAGWRLRELRETDALARSLAASEHGAGFDPETVAGLPEPARRYFRHAIDAGTRLTDAVRLAMHGTIRLAPERPWRPMQARQILAPRRGFVWQAEIGRGLVRVAGEDWYLAGRAATRFWLGGMLPVARAGGGARARDVARSAIGRMAAESVWVPASLLPARGVRWEARGEHAAVARLEVEGEPVALTLGLDSGGAVRRLSLERWGDVTPDGGYAAIPFGANVTAERRFAGYTIPSELAVAWWFGTAGAFEFFRATLDSATFEPV